MSSTPSPRRRRLVGPVVFAGLALAVAAVLVPSSPVHVSGWLVGPATFEGRTARQWIAELSAEDPTARAHAVAAVGQLSDQTAAAAPKLAELIRSDPDAGVRAAAAMSLGKMYPASKGHVAELTAGVTDPNPLVRMYCLVALNRVKGDARSALPTLIAAATDEDNDVRTPVFPVTVRQAALRTLAVVAADSPDAVPTLVGVFDESPVPDDTRVIVASGLGLAGRHAAAHAPLVRYLLTDPSPDVRRAAEDALDLIGVSRDGPARANEFDGLTLPDAEQKRLWAIEHAGNVLNVYGFEPVAAALLDADPARLAKHFAAEFVGSEPGEPTRVTAPGYADVVRTQDAGRPPVPLSRDAVVAKFLEWRKVFAGPPKVRLVVATIRPKDAARPDGPWEGKAQLRLAGEHGPGAPAEVAVTFRYETPNPTEQTLEAGGWLRAVHVQQVAVARSPAPLFVERARDRGLNTKLHDNWKEPATHVLTGGVSVTDFDRDGYLDVLITDRTGNALYRGGAGGKFADVSATSGLPREFGQSLVACWVDLDNDGWDDLILDTRVYRNDRGDRFVPAPAHCDLRIPPDASSLLVADYDRDGKIDVYVARSGKPGNLSWLQGRSNDPVGNLLFRNLGDWKFADVTKKTGTRGGHRSSFTAAWLDADNDGWPDLHVPNEFGDGVLLVNNRDGTFRQTPLADRPADFGTMGLAVGDVDNDGNIDVYCANMYSKAGTRVIGNMKPDAYPPAVMEKFRRFVAGSQLHRNTGGLAFEQLGVEKQLAAVGWAYGPALADLDGDGFLDVYATAGYISRDRDKPDG